MKTKTINIYKFSELSEAAKSNAISNLSDINVDYEWWDGIYMDAETIGMKITEFDLDRNRYCKAVIVDTDDTADAIMGNHGEDCDTYKLASSYIADKAAIVDNVTRDEDGEIEDEAALDESLDKLESEFKRALCEEYSIMLQKEYEYLTSEEAIIETIEVIDYDFTEDGKLSS